MFTIIISLLIAVGVLLSLGLTGVFDWIWAPITSVAVFFAANYLISQRFKKIIEAKMQAIQATLMGGQKAVQEKTLRWRFHPVGNPKQAMIEVQKTMHPFFERAHEQLNDFTQYYNWVPLLEKQVTTMRMQLFYQEKNYQMVDKLLPGCVFMEPVSIAMRMARMYVNNDPGLDKFFEKSVGKFRYGDGAIVYGLYAWIAVKKNDIDKAISILDRASKKMENETLVKNIELLKNNKVKQFSLAGLGEEWYALGLEEPRVKFQRQPQRNF